MPFALILAGLLLTVAGVRNTQGELFGLVKSDFSGPGSFIYWLLAIVAIGSLGYVKALRPLSHWFLGLLLLVLLLAQENAGGGGGFFSKFQTAIKGLGQKKQEAATVTGATGPAAVPGLPDLGIGDLLKTPGGGKYLQQLQQAWQHAPAG